MEKEEKLLYKIIAQQDGITVTAEVSKEMTFDEAKKIAVASQFLIGKKEDYQPFVIVPITTKERWEDRTINFCPRCGANLIDYKLEQSAMFDCFECDTSMQIHIDYSEEVFEFEN